MASSFKEWLQQGEQLYNTALREYHDLERQIGELEARLAEKQGEINQIAQVIGKPLVEATVRSQTQIVQAEIIEAPGRAPTPGANANIARALTGKFGR